MEGTILDNICTGMFLLAAFGILYVIYLVTYENPDRLENIKRKINRFRTH